LQHLTPVYHARGAAGQGGAARPDVEDRRVPHTIREKTKLLNRARRIGGQVNAIERALESERPCADILNLIVAARGAMNALMAEVLEEHVRSHVLGNAKPDSPRTRAAEELVDVVRAYLK
jgi:DNA-binding FrmR family transcriptional regulator